MMRNGRTLCARTVGVCLALAFGIGEAANAEPIIRIGVNTARLSWARPEGLVGGYMVYTQRNGGPSEYEAYSEQNDWTLEAGFGDEVVVEVRALGRATPDGPVVVSALSEPSQPIQFLPAPSWDISALAAMSSDETDEIRVHAYERANSQYRFPGRQAPWAPIGAADFNGDSQQEILWRNETTGALEIAWIGSPSTTLASSAQSGMSQRVVLGTGDLDGDGDTDLLVHDLGLDRVRMWHVTSNGSIEPSVPFDGLVADVVGIADLGADGTDEVWTYDAIAGFVDVFRADGRNSPIARYNVGNHGTIERVADFAGDGAPDVLWRTPARSFALTYLGTDLQVQRTAVFPGTAFDTYLDVSGTASFSTETGLDLVLHNRFDKSMWLFLPGFETANNRIRLLDSNGEGWVPFEILR